MLNVTEYNRAYFDGDLEESLGGTAHPAGYSKYDRWYRHEGENSLGEMFLDRANGWINHLVLANKKVLELGCAKGFLVESLRELGVDAYGLDVSQYAIDSVTERYNEAYAQWLIDVVEDPLLPEPVDYSPYFYVGDARTYLANFGRNEFDVVFSVAFLECVPETDVDGLITEIKRISKQQHHILHETSTGDYLEQPLSWWLQKAFPKNTRLISHLTGQEVIK